MNKTKTTKIYCKTTKIYCKRRLYQSWSTILIFCLLIKFSTATWGSIMWYFLMRIEFLYQWGKCRRYLAKRKKSARILDSSAFENSFQNGAKYRIWGKTVALYTLAKRGRLKRNLAEIKEAYEPEIGWLRRLISRRRVCLRDEPIGTPR